MEILTDDCLRMVFEYLPILDRLRVEKGMYREKLRIKKSISKHAYPASGLQERDAFP